MEQVLAMASDLIMTVVMGVLVVLIGTAKKYATEKIKLIQDEKVHKMSMNALDRADDLAEKVVKKMQQTMVGKMKKESADGKLTKEEILDIGKQTQEELGNLMNVDLYDALEQTVGDVNLYMENLIEAKVLDLKKDFITVKTLEDNVHLGLSEMLEAGEAEIV